MVKKQPQPPLIEPKQFQSPEEIDHAISKLERRIQELEALNVQEVVINETGEDSVAVSNIHESIRDIFGSNSPEFQEHGNLSLWSSLHVSMDQYEVIASKQTGQKKALVILRGLIARLEEKRGEFTEASVASPTTYFDKLNLHPRIVDVSRDLFLDGHHWEAVFNAAKALVNYVKERSGRHELDGTALMRTVFSKNSPILAFNNLSDQPDLDEQEGMMHLFEGAMLAIRNPGGHSFPEGSQQRAIEYISLLSLLAFRVQEAKKPK